jgi:hypothetical protein
MTGLFLSAWILFPLLLLVASLGSGLLVRRISAGAVSGVLLLPVGFALVISICTLGTSITWLAPATGAIALAVGVLGIVLELPGGRPALPRAGAIVWPAIAAVVAFAVIGAPVFLTGTPSWTGFGRIVDTAFQMAFSQHLSETGRSVPVGDSSFNETILGLTGNGYPGGAQATLGAISGLIRTEAAWCYQAFLAYASAMGALALFAILRRVVRNPIVCCIGAAVAIQPNILYDYALEGGIKELTTAALILLAAAVLVEWLALKDRPLRSALPLAPAVAAATSAFSYGVIPWLGLIVLAALAISFLARNRLATLASWVLAGVASAILAIPTVISSIKLFGTAKEAVTGVVEVGLGNLTAPIPEIAAVGVWISNDYRFPQYAHRGLSHDLDVVILVAWALGVLFAAYKRRWMVAAFGITAPIALTYVVAHAGPWVELKGYTITATMFLAMAFVATGVLASARPRKLGFAVRASGWVATLGLAGIVLYGNALTYHDTSLASAHRYRELEAIGKRFAGKGPAFFPAFDEYAEYFLRREHAFDLVRPPGLQIRPGSLSLPPGQFAYALDLNQLVPSFLKRFPLLVIPRSPVASRPPANYDIAEKTSEFEVWERKRPASEVLAHLPLSGSPTERTRAYCSVMANTVRNTKGATSVAYVPSPPRVVLNPVQATHPDYWHASGPEALRPYGAGAVEGTISLPASGTYEVAMPGSASRRLTMYVDGREVGSFANEVRYPGQFLRFGFVHLSAGSHQIRMVRPDGNLGPASGDGPDNDSGVIGVLMFTLQQPTAGRLVVAPVGQAAKICAARVGYQWIELLGARDGATAQA